MQLTAAALVSIFFEDEASFKNFNMTIVHNLSRYSNIYRKSLFTKTIAGEFIMSQFNEEQDNPFNAKTTLSLTI